MAGLPKHFSLISAQLGPDHDDRAHRALLSDLQGLKMAATETEGSYGYPEKSVMVEHGGSAEDLSAIDALGRKYQQQSVLHSSFKGTKGKKGAHHNELRYMDGRPSVFGKGYRVDQDAKDHYTDHPSIGRFQMHLDFGVPEEDKAASSEQGQPEASNASVNKSRRQPRVKVAKKDLVKAMSAPVSEESKDDSEADKQAKIREKLEALRAKVKEEIIPAKDLAEGLEQPEEECPACESQSEECSCYEGLSRPRLEFDGKKVTIFFKSDWSAEDKDNFKEDLKKRAGIILRKREEARSNALVKAKKLIDTVRKGKK